MTLTQEQLSAIQTDAQGTVFVRAGAGTGKTTVLIQRILWLVCENGTPPANIAAVTYTVNAAAELRYRLDRECIKIGFVGTIHALALHVLKLAQPAKKFVVLSSEEDAELLKAAAQHVGYKGSLAELFSIATGHGGRVFEPVSARAAVVEYHERKGDRLTFDELIREAFRHTPKPVTNFAFDTILLDEYQDATEATWELILELSRSQFCIGDPSQSVFSFNGGGYVQPSEDDTVFQLGQTQRCATRICEVANQVMRGPGYIPLRSSIQHGVITVQEHADWAAEIFDIPARINAHRPDQSIGVLARTRFVAQSLQGTLDQYGFKQQKERSIPFSMRLLRFLENPEDDALAKFFLETTRDEEQANRIELEAAQRFQSINQHSLHVPAIVTATDAASFLERCGSFGAMPVALTLPETATVTDLILALSEPGPVEKCNRYLGTIHGAKGLEFDTVIVVGCEDSLLPLAGADEAEERRLLYVALTRARTRVVLSWCRERSVNEWSKPTAQKLSRFLEGLK